MGEYKNQDDTGKVEQQDDKAAFGQFDKDKQQEQTEVEKDELAGEKTDKPL